MLTLSLKDVQPLMSAGFVNATGMEYKSPLCWRGADFEIICPRSYMGMYTEGKGTYCLFTLDLKVWVRMLEVNSFPTKQVQKEIEGLIECFCPCGKKPHILSRGELEKLQTQNLRNILKRRKDPFCDLREVFTVPQKLVSTE